MDYPKHIDRISMEEQSILDSKELPVNISIKRCISVPEDCFILAISADPDEMPPYAAFRLVSPLFAIELVYWRPISLYCNAFFSKYLL